LVLRRGDGGGGAHGVLHVRGLDVKVGELGFELVHYLGDLRRESSSILPCTDYERRERTYPFQVHALHRRVHAADHRRHVARDLTHGHRRLDTTGYGIDTAGKPEEVQRLAFLADRVRGVDAGAVGVALL
jgi:hypothetical protein